MHTVCYDFAKNVIDILPQVEYCIFNCFMFLWWWLVIIFDLLRTYSSSIYLTAVLINFGDVFFFSVSVTVWCTIVANPHGILMLYLNWLRTLNCTSFNQRTRSIFLWKSSKIEGFQDLIMLLVSFWRM